MAKKSLGGLLQRWKNLQDENILCHHPDLHGRVDGKKPITIQLSTYCQHWSDETRTELYGLHYKLSVKINKQALLKVVAALCCGVSLSVKHRELI